MITLPNYDDQTFQDIMEMARRRIPVICPEWTDLNEHDPGITLLELFAWLKEMQQYHLNRITDKSLESILGLLGITAREPVASNVRVAFPDLSSEVILPRGLRFVTTGGIVFECPECVHLNRFHIESIYACDGSAFMDVRDMIMEPGIYCHVFGQKQAEGESALYIGVDRLETDMEIGMYLQLDDSYPVPRNPFKDSSYIPEEIIWEYGVLGVNGMEFIPVETVNDKTFGFSQSGEVILRITGAAYCSSPHDGLPQCYWLRARLIKKGCEENPRLANIYTDTIVLRQVETHCEIISRTLAKQTKKTAVELRSRLALEGDHIVFVRDYYGWRIHNDFTSKKVSAETGEVEKFILTNLPKDLALDGDENIRILCYEPEFGGLMVLKGSNGLPCQRFPFQYKDTILTQQLYVMVYEETQEGPERWLDWKFSPRLSRSGPYDRCFSYDKAAGELVFGDNEHGAVPLPGENNIMIAGCVTTMGSGGNAAQQEFEALEYKNLCVKPIKLNSATGGSDAEDVRDALDRFRATMKQCKRAVTAQDYEMLAASTPGLRVMGAHALPFYAPDSRTAGGNQTAATVSVVVLPYSEEPFSKPDQRFMDAVRNHLEDYRLITTNVRVIEPVYIKISVYTEVILDDNNEDNINRLIRAAIEAHFNELQKGTRKKKPEFGQPVRENILMMKIGEVPGVAHVKKVTLGVRNSESYRDKYGNIIIPPHGLPYLGDLQIRNLV